MPHWADQVGDFPNSKFQESKNSCSINNFTGDWFFNSNCDAVSNRSSGETYTYYICRNPISNKISMIKAQSKNVPDNDKPPDAWRNGQYWCKKNGRVFTLPRNLTENNEISDSLKKLKIKYAWISSFSVSKGLDTSKKDGPTKRDIKIFLPQDVDNKSFLKKCSWGGVLNYFLPAWANALYGDSLNGSGLCGLGSKKNVLLCGLANHAAIGQNNNNKNSGAGSKRKHGSSLVDTTTSGRTIVKRRKQTEEAMVVH